MGIRFIDGLFKVMVGLAIILLIGYTGAYGVAKVYDGETFELENSVLLIKDSGFHFYDKAIQYEFKSDIEYDVRATEDGGIVFEAKMRW